MNQVQDNKFDLFEFFQILWDGKWLISTFVATAVLLGGGFLLSKDVVYESKVIYSVDTLPSFYGKAKALKDFQNKFYSVSVFDEWKQNNNSTTLVFDDFSAIDVVDGFEFSKNEDEQLVTFQNKVGSFVLVKSNHLPLLDDVYKYASHINALIKDEYVFRAKEELTIIETRFKDLSAVDNNIVDTLLLTDRYIFSVKNGASVFAIQRPTIPKKVSPKSSLILALSIVLGGMVGALFVLLRKAIAKRKDC